MKDVHFLANVPDTMGKLNRLQPQFVQVNLLSLDNLAFNVKAAVTKASWVG